jgi:hypothetical protein
MPDELPPKKPLDFDWEETPKLGKPAAVPAPPPVPVEILEVLEASDSLPEAKPVPVVVPVVKPKRPVTPPIFAAPEFPKSRPSNAPPERPARKRQYFAMFVLLGMFLGAIVAILVLMYAFVAGFQHFAPNKLKSTPTSTKAPDAPKKRDAVKE